MAKSYPKGMMDNVEGARRQVKELRHLTMACWWPSNITGRLQPDWEGIRGEMQALVVGATARMDYGTATQGELDNLWSLYHLAEGMAFVLMA